MSTLGSPFLIIFDTNKLYRLLILLQRKKIFGFSLLIFQQSRTCALHEGAEQRVLSLEFLFRSATCRLHNNVPGLHVACTSHTDDSLQFYPITCPQEQGRHGLSFNGAWQLQVPDLCLWIREAGSIVALGLMHQHGRQLCRRNGPSGKWHIFNSSQATLPARSAKQTQQGSN